MGHPALSELYHRCCSTWSDIHEHLPTFVGAVQELDAKQVIELGVRYGISTIAWLYALEGRGHLTSVDCSFPTAGPEIPDVNLLDPQGPLGVIPWWTFVLGYDDWPNIVSMLPDQVDIVFIDTQHTYEQTVLELGLYLPKVRSGGRIYLHDWALEATANAVTPQPAFPVRTAVEDFCRGLGLSCSGVNNCYGLGRIDVP